MAGSRQATTLSSLRSGRRLPRSASLGELQRGRLQAALIDVVELGHAQPTVSQIIDRAHVSRKTFYSLFRDREDCFLATYEEIFKRARELASQAYDKAEDWREGVRAALECLLALMDRHPGLARLCVVHSLAGGERVQLRRSELMALLAATVDLGREGCTSLTDSSGLIAEALVGGAVAVVHRRLVRRDPAPLRDLLGPLMSMIVLPYLGEQAAREELRVRDGAGERIPPALLQGQEDPLSGLKIRLTYRTVRVLVTLAQHPDASNRQVAEGAGILDQGQISKLLARLARLGLVENLGEGQAKGGSNAWRLTAKGAQLERATRPRLV